jgi:hypothetical protein
MRPSQRLPSIGFAGTTTPRTAPLKKAPDIVTAKVGKVPKPAGRRFSCRCELADYDNAARAVRRWFAVVVAPSPRSPFLIGGLPHGRANDPASGVAHSGPLAEVRGEATQRVPPSLHKRTPPHDRRDSENAYGASPGRYSRGRQRAINLDRASVQISVHRRRHAGRRRTMQRGSPKAARESRAVDGQGTPSAQTP